MANMHLVTGFAGYEHVTSADQGLFNSYIFGDLEVVLERGNQFAASIISNNIIRVKDGDLLMQGRFARLNDDSYVDLTIDNGTQGYFRNDLIVARYQKDVVTAVETVDLVVIKGENAESDPVDPAHVKGDIKFGKDFQNDIPLWRVSLDGLNVTGLTCLFSTFGSTLSKLIAHADTHAVGGSDPLTLERLGIGNYTHPASKVGITKELAEVIGSDANAESALAVIGSAFASAVSEASYGWRVIEPSKPSYVISEVESSNSVISGKLAYSDEITSDGTTITLVDPVVVTYSAATDFTPLLGKFYLPGDGTTVSGTSVRYFHPDGTLSGPSGNYVIMRYREVTPKMTEPVVVGGKVSIDINAYPHNEKLDGLYYEFLGKLIDSLMSPGAKIQTGSYVGTGTYGESNPNVVTLDFAPQLFGVLAYVQNGTTIVHPGQPWVMDAFLTTDYKLSMGLYNTDGSTAYAKKSLDGKTIYWYNGANQGQQLNGSGTVFYWVAIGQGGARV
mgnify:CR=1 FL=1